MVFIAWMMWAVSLSCPVHCFCQVQVSLVLMVVILHNISTITFRETHNKNIIMPLLWSNSAGGGAFDVNLSCRVEFYGSFCVAWDMRATGSTRWQVVDRALECDLCDTERQVEKCPKGRVPIYMQTRGKEKLTPSAKKGLLLWCARINPFTAKSLG